MDLEWIEESYNVSLSKDELNELLSLDYILSQGYSGDTTKDTDRYIELSNRRWSSQGRDI